MTESASVEMRHVDALQPGMAITVVALPFVRVAQHLEGLGAFPELVRRFLVPVVAVGMVLHGQPAVRPLDRVVVGVACDFQDFVVVAFAGHRSLRSVASEAS